MLISVQMVQAPCVEARASPDNTMDLVSFVKQHLGPKRQSDTHSSTLQKNSQVRPILARNT